MLGNLQYSYLVALIQLIKIDLFAIIIQDIIHLLVLTGYFYLLDTIILTHILFLFHWKSTHGKTIIFHFTFQQILLLVLKNKKNNQYTYWKYTGYFLFLLIMVVHHNRYRNNSCNNWKTHNTNKWYYPSFKIIFSSSYRQKSLSKVVW